MTVEITLNQGVMDSLEYEWVLLLDGVMHRILETYSDIAITWGAQSG